MARGKTSVLGTSLALVLLAGLAGGCTVGPKYHTPSTQAPPAYKEATPPAPAPATVPVPSGNTAPGTSRTTTSAPAAIAPERETFRVAEPSDDTIRSRWWEMFNDPELNALEEQVNVSNQTLAAATASYFSARAIVREARSQYFPVVAVGVAAARQRTSSSGSSSSSSSPDRGSVAAFSDPLSATWEPDLWGRVRNQVSASRAAAQASAADLENIRLSIHSELAVDYFALRGQDALKQLLDSSVADFRQSLDLTRALYETGIDSDEAVAQAETQLNSAEAEAINVGILRAQFEHAIAVLVGQLPSTFSVSEQPQRPAPPVVPVATPSKLLERRPDIAAAERAMAQANAQIGVATSAFYPNVTLSATVGFSSTSAADWFTWPSRVWSVGSALTQTVFDAGLRRATVQQFRGVYDQEVALYRQTVLTAFQQVEDNLSSQRILAQEIQQQDAAVASAQRNLGLATERYRLGIDPYLNVIAAETAYLNNQQTALNLRTQQLTSSVGLIEALGGGWDISQLPSASAVAQVSMPSTSATPAPPQPQQPPQPNP